MSLAEGVDVWTPRFAHIHELWKSSTLRPSIEPKKEERRGGKILERRWTLHVSPPMACSHNASDAYFAYGYRYGVWSRSGSAWKSAYSPPSTRPRGCKGDDIQYKLRGRGHTVGDDKNGKKFTHRSLKALQGALIQAARMLMVRSMGNQIRGRRRSGLNTLPT